MRLADTRLLQKCDLLERAQKPQRRAEDGFCLKCGLLKRDLQKRGLQKCDLLECAQKPPRRAEDGFV